MSTHPIEPCEPRWMLTFFGVDHNYAGYGFATTQFGRSVTSNVEFVKGLPGGFVLAAGQGQQQPPGGARTVAIARYDATGELDPTFGTNGKVDTPLLDAILDAAVQSDGKIIVVGGRDRQFFIARYTFNGAVDSTFGTNGVTSISFGKLGANQRALATAVAIQTDDKIVVAGRRTSKTALYDAIAVARLDANGALDPTFSNEGGLITDFDKEAIVEDVAVSPAGKVLVAGDQANGTAGFLMRYNADGTLDKTLAGDGSVELGVIPDGQSRNVTTVAALPNERILVAVRSKMIRLLADGSADGSFGTGGVVQVVPPLEFDRPTIENFTLDTVGNIITVTDSRQGGIGVRLVRLTPDGALDASFGPDGQAAVPEILAARSVDVAEDDTIYVGRAFGFSVGKVSMRPVAEVDPLGIVQIHGDEGDDAISVNDVANTLRVSRNGKLLLSEGGTITGINIITGDGDDSLTVETSFQLRVQTGAGDDSITVPKNARVIDAGNGNNTITIGLGNTTIITGSGKDRITTGGGNKTIDGGGGNDRITTGSGDDFINAGKGNNIISTGSGDDTIEAGGGNDSITSGNGFDRITPSGGDDTITAGADDDFIAASRGIKSIDAGPGNDQIGGDFFFLTAFGSGGAGTINGGTGNDLIAGGQAGLSVVITGGDGNDTLHAFGDATLFGNAGDDSLHGAGSSTVVRGGDGRDSIRGSEFADSLYGEAGPDTIFGSDGNDLISGGGGNDRILGQSGNDRIYGGLGADRPDGGPGKDRIFGQDDNDIIVSRDGGVDTVDGGTGADDAQVDLIDLVAGVENLLP